MIVFLDSGNPVQNPRPSVDVTPDRYSGLMLVVKGTTDVGQTLDEADIGRIRIERFGTQYYSSTFELFHDYSAQKGGYVSRTVPTAGASRITAAIPAGFPFAPNSWDITSKEEMDVFLEFDSATLGTRFGANVPTWELYGILGRDVPETYRLKVLEQNQQASGAGRLDRQLDARNVGILFLRDSAGIVSQVQVRVDGTLVVDNIDDETLLDYTNLVNRVETSGNNLIEIPVAREVAEALNANVNTSIQFTGAGTLGVVIFAVDTIPPDFANASQRRVAEYLRSKVAREANAIRVLAPAGALVG